MATVMKVEWAEPAPRTRVEAERLALLDRWTASLGSDSVPHFLRQEVMVLAGIKDSDWRWLEYNRFVEGTVLPDESYRRYSVKEIRAIRLAIRLKKGNVRRSNKLSPRALSNFIKLEVNLFLSRPPIQATLPLDIAEAAAIRDMAQRRTHQAHGDHPA